MDFIKIWEVIVRRKWIILLSFSVFLATVIVGSHFVAPVYETTAKIVIESSDSLSSVLSALGINAPSTRMASGTQETYDTEVAMITMRPLLEKLVSGIDSEGNENKLDPDRLAGISVIKKMLGKPGTIVEQYRDSDILEITSISTDPEMAATLSNQLAELYIADRLEQAREEYKTARLFIDAQIKEVKQKYYHALVEKKNFMIHESTVDLNKETFDLLELISGLEDDYRDNELAIEEASQAISLTEQKIAENEYIPKEVLVNLESRLTDLLTEVSGLLATVTTEDLDVKQLNQEIETLRDIIKQKTSDHIKDNGVSLTPIYETLLMDFKEAYVNWNTGIAKRQLLSRYIDAAKKALVETPPKLMKQSELDLALSVHQGIYQELLAYLTQVGIVESMTLSNVKLVEPASVPKVDKPDFPNKVFNYIFGGCLGLFLSLSLGFFIEYNDRSIKNADELEGGQFNFLGAIPKFGKIKRTRLISNTDVNDPIFEAYRRVITSIDFAAAGTGISKLLVSSIEPKTGSSVTSANLAIVRAMEGKRVLLVDADLRRPSIHMLFKRSNKTGLSDLLLGKTEFADAILNTDIEGLWILPSGPKPPDPGMLLKSDKMCRLVEAFQQKFDFVVFDSAPLLTKADALILSKLAEGLAVVLKNNETTPQSISRVSTLFKNAQVIPTGVVLNFA